MEINHKRYWYLQIYIDVKDHSEHLYHIVADLVNEHSLGKIYLIGTEITKFAHLFNSKTFSFDNIQELIENHGFNSIENSLILLKGARKFELEILKKNWNFSLMIQFWK